MKKRVTEGGMMRRLWTLGIAVSFALVATAGPAAATDLCWLLDRWPHC